MRQSIIVLAIAFVIGLLTRGEVAQAVETPTPLPARLTQTQTTYQIYIVQPGDTFWRIARNHRISLTELLAVNPRVNPARLSIGQRIRIPLAASRSRPAAPTVTRARATPRPSSPERDVLTYVVKPGDTIWRIAAEYGVAARSLMKINRIGQPNMLVVGQVLVIPRPAATATPTAANATTPAVKVASTPTPAFASLTTPTAAPAPTSTPTFTPTP